MVGKHWLRLLNNNTNAVCAVVYDIENDMLINIHILLSDEHYTIACWINFVDLFHPL